ncbi:hypothetical protein H0H81_000467 [Sphagnurus paluster]|uniref:Uncharacterized protein n=1 Tax=Sphagnurus paluster TaxID=117069 RepID=A0A9P7FTI8_9AGAR|nr:hypothetical protein H0H81_000467 [Sphagnurus paluster]
MNAIQSLISGWENLEALEMSNWREPDLAESQDIPPLSGKIQSLLLQRGQLTGPHLMRFVAGERSRLRELHLFDIKKLSNGELLACLKAVAPTLSRVSIMHCTISTENELAIDAAMPELVALRSLSIDDSCIGIPSIERKRSTVPGKQVDGSVQIMEIFGKLSISPEGLASAMHITGWAKISLEPLGPAWTPAIVENIQKIASERGIVFSCATISNFTGEEFPFP